MTKKKLAGGFILAMLLVVALVAYVQAQTIDAENGIADSSGSQGSIQGSVTVPVQGDESVDGILTDAQNDRVSHEFAAGKVDEASNGFPANLTSGSATLGPVVVDGLWYQFTWSGSTVSGCPGCSTIPSITDNADDPPWTFTAGSGGAFLVVTDAYLNGDQFEVFDFGVSQGLTSSVPASGSCGDNPVPCLASPDASSGIFYLAPGSHSINIELAANPFGSGGAFFRVISNNVVVDGPWNQFGWSSGLVTGCSPADPSGPACIPSVGGNSIFADAPPWTFTAGPDGAMLTVTDAFTIDDQFEVFDFGSSIGLTSVPGGGTCGSDPEICVTNPDASSGTFYLAPGPHAITINLASVDGSGAAYFRVDSLVVGGYWYEWAQIGGVVSGCDPADPAGPGCTPSSGDNSVYAGPPPWTFTAPPGGAVLTVVDAFLIGDRFEVFDGATSLGLTSPPVGTESCGSDPEICLADPDASKAEFFLEPGPHSITFDVIENPHGNGAQYFRVDSYTVFLPIIVKNP